MTTSLLYSMFGGILFSLFTCASLAVIQEIVRGRIKFSELLSHSGASICLSVFFGLFAGYWCILHFLKVCQAQKDIRNYRLGARGEQAVAECLADPKLASAGYRAFHDVPAGDSWNIDHVVIGPAGAFVIETKCCPRREPTIDQEDNKVVYDGSRLRYPWRYDDRAVRQAEANARWVREFLRNFGPGDLMVQPLIVLPGWYVESKGNFPVKAMNAKYLLEFLAGMEKRLTLEQLRPMVARLDEKCRTLEF